MFFDINSLHLLHFINIGQGLRSLHTINRYKFVSETLKARYLAMNFLQILSC